MKYWRILQNITELSLFFSEINSFHEEHDANSPQNANQHDLNMESTASYCQGEKNNVVF